MSSEPARLDPVKRTEPKIAVVTATWNRLDLLGNLHDSLSNQTDQDFEWLVVDDASTDDTVEWLEGLVAGNANVQFASNAQNLGKCASLNRLFRMSDADFYLVVDSDDTLLPDAISVVKSQVGKLANVTNVGAIFFSFSGADESRLRSPNPFPDGIVIGRAAFNETYGKFDGCAGYFHRVVEKFEYPEYEAETYVGPTVLQLRMHPDYQICFTHTEVGVARYQPGGLTESGRQLRIANPMGMMEYCRLQAEQSSRFTGHMINCILYYAYRALFSKRSRTAAPKLTMRPALSPIAKLLGFGLSNYWRRRHAR